MLAEQLHYFVEKHARRFLSERYWNEEHLDSIQQETGKSYTYIRDDDYDVAQVLRDLVRITNQTLFYLTRLRSLRHCSVYCTR